MQTKTDNNRPAEAVSPRKLSAGNVFFNAILAKNSLARSLKSQDWTAQGYIVARLQEIERALALAIKRNGQSDNQPSVEEIMSSTLDV